MDSNSDHIAELSNARPKRPFFFLKPPSSILEHRGGPVLRPRGTTLHYEVELALIMRHRLTNLRPDEEEASTVMEAIDGYLVAIDMTARNVQDEAKSKGLPWTTAKGFDTFLPVSRFIDRSIVPDPHDVELWLDVDRKSRQRDSTGLMLFRIPRLLGEISRVMTLHPGDIVCTGTPKGVGEVKPGQRMTAGLRIGGKEPGNIGIQVGVEESASNYIFQET